MKATVLQANTPNLKKNTTKFLTFEKSDQPPFEHPDWESKQHVRELEGLSQVLLERGLC